MWQGTAPSASSSRIFFAEFTPTAPPPRAAAPVLAVGDAVTFRAAGDGVVELRINDDEGCLHDNEGELTVSGEVTPSP
ncbi:hypothetical protein [Streptomyces hirsutus]|uniref:hypothetical protein n=1 Tax=Streptomyces hirsutus TaxID=35620 RepID=UPI0036CC39C6